MVFESKIVFSHFLAGRERSMSSFSPSGKMISPFKKDDRLLFRRDNKSAFAFLPFFLAGIDMR